MPERQNENICPPPTDKLGLLMLSYVLSGEFDIDSLAFLKRRSTFVWLCGAMPHLSHVIRKSAICHMQTTKAQISLRMSAV